MIARFTGSGRMESVFDSYVSYFQEEMPVSCGYVNFADATLRLRADASIEQVDKSPGNNVYLHIRLT